MNLVLLGWLRPVRDPKAESSARLRPSEPTLSPAARICERLSRNSRSGRRVVLLRAI